MNLQEFRQQFPQYNDMSDQDLADSLYRKFYSDMSREQFDAQIGIGDGGDAAPSAPALNPSPETRLPGGGVSVPLHGGRPQAAPDASLGVAEPGMGMAALRGGGRRLLDNLLAVPEVAFNLPQQAIMSGINAIAGTNAQPLQIDMPSAAEVTADVQALVNTPEALLTGDPRSFRQRAQDYLERQQSVDIRFNEAAPFSTTVGEIGGDIATLLALRTGGRTAMTGTAAPALPAAAPATAGTVESVIGNSLKSFANTVGRAGGRAAQAGGETALLATLQNADPAEAAALASGTQLVSDLAKGTFTKLTATPARLLGSIAIAASGALAVEQWTPGGLDRVLPSLEDANKHVWLSVVLSGLTSLPARQPGGALRGSQVATERVLGDLLGAVPRSAMEATVVWAVNNPAVAKPILQKFSEDPEYFGPKAQRLLVRAMTTEGADLGATVESLMDDREFRQKFEALSGEDAPPAAEAIADAVKADTSDGLPWRKPTKVAETAAARLGKERARGFGWEQNNVGSRTFLSNAIEGGGGELLRDRLGAKDWQDVLVADLENRLMEASRRQDGRLVLDGNRLERAWERLPKKARALYPSGTEDAVLALAERARAESINGALTFDIARSLLQQDGELRALLTPKKKRQPTGPRRSRVGLLELED